MEFCGPVLQKAGTGALPRLGSCWAFPRAVPAATTSHPKSRISFGASVIFLCLRAKSWKVLEGAGFSSSSSSRRCPTPRRRWCPEGAVDPFPWRIPHPTPATAARMFRHQGQEVGEAFPALFLHLGILCRDSGRPRPAQHPLDLWKSGIVTSRLPLCRHNPTSRGYPSSSRSSSVFRVIHGVRPCLSLDPGILQLLQHGPNPAEHDRSGCSVIPASVIPASVIPAGSPARSGKKIPRILEVKVVPASSRSSRISAGIAALGIQRAGIERNITGNVPGTPGYTRSGDLTWRRRRRKRKAEWLFTSRECSWITGREAKSQPDTSDFPGKREQRRLSWNCKA